MSLGEASATETCLPGASHRMSVPVDRCSATELLALANAAAEKRTELALSDDAWSRIEQAHRVLRQLHAERTEAYGVTTGVGSFAAKSVPEELQEEHQARLLRSHAAGVGPLLPRATVVLMLLLRIRTIARGHSGTAPETVRALLAMLEEGLVPEVPSRGSVGASGDLAPLAHAMLPLIGEGWCRDSRGRRVTGRQAMVQSGSVPCRLGAKEALSLINGTALCAALVLEGWQRCRQLWEAACGTSAMAFRGLSGRTGVLDERVAALHGLPGTSATAARLRWWLGLRNRCAERGSAVGQDPYSLRCAPQVLGALLADLEECEARLPAVLDSVTDNPLLDVDAGALLSGGNFHGLMLGRLADRLCSLAANLGGLLERQIALAIDGRRTGLPDFLITDGGLNSGLMMHQVTAAALASELKLLAQPSSVDSIPTSNDQEDLVPMAPAAGLRLRDAVERLAELTTLALVTQAQAMTLQGAPAEGAPVEALQARVADVVPPLRLDRTLADEIQTLATTFVAWDIWGGLGADRCVP